MIRNRRTSITENMTTTFRNLRLGRQRRGSLAGAGEHDGCQRDIVYARFSDIPAREVVSCADVWGRLADVLGPRFEFEGIQTNGLWGLVFAGGWTTADQAGERPQLPPRDLSRLLVEVGTWKDDLPKPVVSPPSPPPSSLPSLPSELTGLEKPIPDFPGRRKGAPAYVIFTAIADGHLYGGTFTFCDADTNPAPQSMIDYKLLEGDDADPPVSSRVLARAVARFDDHERERLQAFNEDLAVHVVRKRLCRWAREGYRAARSVPASDEADMAAFASLQVSNTVLGLMCDASEALGGDNFEEEYDVYF